MSHGGLHGCGRKGSGGGAAGAVSAWDLRRRHGRCSPSRAGGTGFRACGARARVWSQGVGRAWHGVAGPGGPTTARWRGARPSGAAASGAARMVVGKRMPAVRMTRWPEKVFFPPTKLATQIYGGRKMPWKNRDHPVEELDEIYKMIPLVAAEDEWMERNFLPEFHRSWRELEISRLDLGN